MHFVFVPMKMRDRLGAMRQRAPAALSSSRIFSTTLGSGWFCTITTPSSLRQSAAQYLGEDDGVVVLGVPGGEDEGECAVARSLPELREPRALATELPDIAAAKLLEATRLVPEPLPEFRTRWQLSLPLIELGPLA